VKAHGRSAAVLEALDERGGDDGPKPCAGDESRSSYSVLEVAVSKISGSVCSIGVLRSSWQMHPRNSFVGSMGWVASFLPG
jgi:hypothetical protein